MKSFLRLVAENLMARWGENLSRVTVVFPGKRAGLFLSQELSAITPQPMWAPHYISIDELFMRLSHNTVADPITSITTLYDIYQSLLPEEKRGEETIDRFWGWGEVLLSDFDDIDKHLVDADKLFLNAKELNELNDETFLSKEQFDALKQFFTDFDENHLSKIKAAFRLLWDRMPALYRRLKEEMPENTVPYKGALMRQVAENPDITNQIPQEMTYAFVGFNMISESEEQLMRTLQKRGQAIFFWDYDLLYMAPNFEAGEFIRKNMEKFPNQLDRSEFNNIKTHPGFTFVSAPTDSIQTRYIPEWLSSHLDKKEENRTAIVLCDENLLETVLHSIPDENGPHEVNITMGYNMAGTPTYSLIVALLDLQTEGVDRRHKRFRSKMLKSVATHPYIQKIEESIWNNILPEGDQVALLEYIDRILTEETLLEALQQQPLAALHRETLFQAHVVMQKFIMLLSDKERPLVLKELTLRRLLRRALGRISVPFHGEPATGLQVMGVLETRCLDFNNILLLSVGEGFLPKNGVDTSIIPYTLRTGFGMTTIGHRMATFAYYFYRLIQRARHVTCIYNDSTAGVRRNEMSRFLRQLQAETDIPIESLRLESGQETTTYAPPVIEKTPDVMERLWARYLTPDEDGKTPLLSPSALNEYLRCPLSFFLSHVAEIREQDDLEDGIDARVMGNIFHEAAHKMYEELIGRSGGNKTISQDQISLLLADHGRRIQPYIDEAFQKEGGVSDFQGENIILRAVVERFLLNLLRYDRALAPFTILKMEKSFCFSLKVNRNGEPVTIRTGGIIDRLDMLKDGTVRVVDYKTGGHLDKDVTMDKIFQKGDHAGYYLQTLLYSLAYIKKAAERHEAVLPVKPLLFYPAKAATDDYDPTLILNGAPLTDLHEGSLISDYEERLQNLVEEVFNESIPFQKTDNSPCKMCPYRTICLS